MSLDGEKPRKIELIRDKNSGPWACELEVGASKFKQEIRGRHEMGTEKQEPDLGRLESGPPPAAFLPRYSLFLPFEEVRVQSACRKLGIHGCLKFDIICILLGQHVMYDSISISIMLTVNCSHFPSFRQKPFGFVR